MEPLQKCGWQAVEGAFTPLPPPAHQLNLVRERRLVLGHARHGCKVAAVLLPPPLAGARHLHPHPLPQLRRHALRWQAHTPSVGARLQVTAVQAAPGLWLVECCGRPVQSAHSRTPPCHALSTAPRHAPRPALNHKHLFLQRAPPRCCRHPARAAHLAAQLFELVLGRQLPRPRVGGPLVRLRRLVLAAALQRGRLALAEREGKAVAVYGGRARRGRLAGRRCLAARRLGGRHTLVRRGLQQTGGGGAGGGWDPRGRIGISSPAASSPPSNLGGSKLQATDGGPH